MTESEWLGESAPPADARRPGEMVSHLEALGVLRTKAGRRRLRLFACAYARAGWDLLADDRLREAVRVAERFADGAETKAELTGAYWEAKRAANAVGAFGGGTAESAAATTAAWSAEPRPGWAALMATTLVDPRPGADAHRRGLVRCVFGNPFRPVAAERRWRTAAVVGVARAIYDGRTFHDLPVLADALQEAGCDDAAVLEHCRGPGSHARGCWVVDLALGTK